MKQLEDGTLVYDCLICRDGGWVHPINEHGRPDWGKVVPCRCRRQQPEAGEQSALFPEQKLMEETNAAPRS